MSSKISPFANALDWQEEPPPAAMALDPPPDGWTDISLDNLILRIQSYTGPKGYAVVKARTK